MNSKIILFIVFVIIFSLPLFLIQQFTGVDFAKLSLAQFGPTIAFILLAILFKGTYISINTKISKIIIVKTIFSIIIPFLLYSVTYFIGKFLGIKLLINSDIQNIMLNYSIWIIIGAIGEEIGWRSFLQPMLDKKYPIFVSSLVVGIIWGLWHINHFINGPLFVFGFLIFSIAYSIIIMYLLKNTEYSLIISSMFHASINLSFKVFLENSYGNSKLFLIHGIIWLIAAIIIVTFQREYYFKKQNTST